jgi:hypothetical protein
MARGTNLTAGPGRPKGARNKLTVLLKDAILKAAERAGGSEGLVGYLQTQAVENPGPFLALLGKVLPMQLSADDEGGPMTIVINRFADGSGLISAGPAGPSHPKTIEQQG